MTTSDELDRFFDLSLDLLCIAGIDGRFRRVNPAFETLLGYTREELVSRPFFDFVYPEDREVTLAELVNLRRGAKTIAFENRYMCKDGSVKWLAWTASPATPDGRIYAAARDITRAKEAEDALRRSEARTRSIIDNLLGGLVTADADGKIESMNRAAERMFGSTSPSLIGAQIAVLFGDAFDDARRRGEIIGRVTEWNAVRANGETFVCELSVFEFDAGDRTRHFAAHVLDVSEREEVERMKKDFVATVSHELRTPLTSIHGSLGLLAAGVMGELNAEAAKVVSVAERNSVRLVTLINDLLEFEKLDEGKATFDVRTVPLQPILDDSIASVAAIAAEAGVTLEIESLDALVSGDAARLTQALVNLLSNAVKFSHAGGVVTVSTRVVDAFVEIRVRDRGVGIPQHAQKKLFQRFQQIDSGDARSKSGTGLGLAICRAIIEQHGGSVGVESTEGEGSTFWFRVPMARVTTGELA
ncbi:MAG TPA: PAS domain S-box protein [Thermoanaerobaculia bacterium]|nr:PAS domain S-box protein [Thermoanaerobaculia bacterium]